MVGRVEGATRRRDYTQLIGGATRNQLFFGLDCSPRM
jgi:hypothetical protein